MTPRLSINGVSPGQPESSVVKWRLNAVLDEDSSIYESTEKDIAITENSFVTKVSGHLLEIDGKEVLKTGMSADLDAILLILSETFASERLTFERRYRDRLDFDSLGLRIFEVEQGKINLICLVSPCNQSQSPVSTL